MENPTPAARPVDRLKHFIRHQVMPLVILIGVMLAARSSLADWNDVPTGSMNPAILEGDRIYVNKLAYGLKIPFTTTHVFRWGTPQRGEVVVFFAPHDGTRMVKRVAAVPGDTVEMRDGLLSVNGAPAVAGPPDADWLTDLPVAFTNSHHIGSETLGGHRHPVMLTPSRPNARNFSRRTVPAGKYVLIGDNRDNSLDSRFWGEVDEDQIVGRAGGIAFSLDPTGTLKPRWGRFFKGLP